MEHSILKIIRGDYMAIEQVAKLLKVGKPMAYLHSRKEGFPKPEFQIHRKKFYPKKETMGYIEKFLASKDKK